MVNDSWKPALMDHSFLHSVNSSLCFPCLSLSLRSLYLIEQFPNVIRTKFGTYLFDDFMITAYLTSLNVDTCMYVCICVSLYVCMYLYLTATVLCTSHCVIPIVLSECNQRFKWIFELSLSC